MKPALKQALLECETDVDGAVSRLLQDEELYAHCLRLFLSDSTLSGLRQALEDQDWEKALTAANGLAGLAGNMGFVPLFNASSELVILLRVEATNELAPAMDKIKSCYDKLTAAIREYF